MADRAAKDAPAQGLSPRVARALASGRRAEIVDYLLAQGERPVEQIAAEIGRSIANTSHHLRAMARAGLVTTRRDGYPHLPRRPATEVADLWIGPAVRWPPERVAGLLRRLGRRLPGQPRRRIELVGRDELHSRRLPPRRGSCCSMCGPPPRHRGTPASPADTLGAGHRTAPPPARAASRRRAWRPTAAAPAAYADAAVRNSPRRGYRARRLIDGYPEWKRAYSHHRSRGRRVNPWPRIAGSIRRAARAGTRQVPGSGRSTRRQLPLPHRPRLWPAASATRPTRWTALPDRAVESFAGVATRSRCGDWRPAKRWSTSAPAAGFDSFIAAGQVGPAGQVVGIDMTAEMLAKSRQTAEGARPRPRPVPRRARRGAPGRGRLGGCGDLQRGHQPVRRQAGGVRRDLPGAAPGRAAPVRRHRQRPPRASRGAARHRPVDRLNSWRAAPCGLAEDAAGQRLHRRGDRRGGRHVRRRQRRGQRPARSTCTATRSWHPPAVAPAYGFLRPRLSTRPVSASLAGPGGPGRGVPPDRAGGHRRRLGRERHTTMAQADTLGHELGLWLGAAADPALRRGWGLPPGRGHRQVSDAPTDGRANTIQQRQTERAGRPRDRGRHLVPLPVHRLP